LIDREQIPWRDLPTLRVVEVASLLGVERRAVERLIEGGELESREVGQVQLVFTSSLRAWLGEIDKPAPALTISRAERTAAQRLLGSARGMG